MRDQLRLTVIIFVWSILVSVTYFSWTIMAIHQDMHFSVAWIYQFVRTARYQLYSIIMVSRSQRCINHTLLWSCYASLLCQNSLRESSSLLQTTPRLISCPSTSKHGPGPAGPGLSLDIILPCPSAFTTMTLVSGTHLLGLFSAYVEDI